MELLTASSTLSLSEAIQGRKYPEHPRFPQLKTASDPDLMLRLFRKGLGWEFEHCVPIRFRWPSDNSHCVLQYELQLQRNRDGRVPPFWVTAFVYPGPDEAAAAWSKQAAVLEARPRPDLPSDREPVGFFPELHMVAYVFPHDRLLPNLPDILSGPWDELRQRLLSCFGAGEWRIERQTVEPLRYLAGDSAVFRYTLQTSNTAEGRAETKRFYAKAYRTRYGEKIAQILHDLHQATADADSSFSVIEPLCYCPQRRCLVLAEAPGRSLQDLLRFNDGDDAIAGVRSVARALAAFNQIKLSLPVSHSAEEQIRFSERAGELLCWACPDSSSLVQALIHKVNSGLRDAPLVPIHWDLKTDHVFLDGERVIFIDLDDVSLGDQTRDPAHLAAHIAARIDVPDMDLELANLIARAFVQEFFAHAPASCRNQFEPQFLIALVEEACGLFKRQEPLWAERAAAILQQAERAFLGEWHII